MLVIKAIQYSFSLPIILKFRRNQQTTGHLLFLTWDDYKILHICKGRLVHDET